MDGKIYYSLVQAMHEAAGVREMSICMHDEEEKGPKVVTLPMTMLERWIDLMHLLVRNQSKSERKEKDAEDESAEEDGGS